MSTPDIKALISIVKTGTRQEVKQAQKAIESAWHHYYIPHRKEGKKAFEAFLPEIGTFDQIADIDHQAHFISSLKWAFWTIGEEYFEIWAAFVLKYIQITEKLLRGKSCQNRYAQFLQEMKMERLRYVN